jgi:PEP-CTERM/exosortase A-associated glycosyltransferase
MVSGEGEVLQGSWRPPAIGTPRRFRPRPGTILHLVGHSAPHSQVGYTVRTHSIARAQRQAGLDPHVVTRLGFPWDDGVAAAGDHDELEGIRYHRLRAEGSTPVRLGTRLDATVRAATELVREIRPAVLHAATDYRNALIASALGDAFRLPVVYEVRGFWEETRLAAQGSGAAERECYVWHRERELAAMQAADRVVTLAEVMRDELVARGLAPEAIAVVPNAVDIDAFHVPGRDAALAERLGILPGETVVGYISTFSRYEGIRFLIDAVARLRADGRAVRCLLVGDGEERVALEAQASALGIAGQVIFTGRVPHAQVLAYYGLIDIFVIPRTSDRVSQLVTPLKPYEAMATGRPVVFSRVPALAEMVEDGVTGLGFGPEDPGDLASVLGGLLVDMPRRVVLGSAGREWVTRHRTWRENGKRYLELYRSLGAA